MIALHGLVGALRQCQLGGQTFSKIIAGGHSLSSGIVNEASTLPHPTGDPCEPAHAATSAARERQGYFNSSMTGAKLSRSGSTTVK